MPSLGNLSLGKLLGGLVKLGFNEVFEVAWAAEILADEIDRYLKKPTWIFPLSPQPVQRLSGWWKFNFPR